MRHHWLSALSVLSSVLIANLATPPASLWDDIRVMHTWNTVPANWESLGPPPPETTIDLHIALKPHHEDALIDALYEVSDPTHQKYGAYLSKEQVAGLVAPHQDTLDIVHSWLEHHGVPSSSISTSHGGGWLTITGVPVSQADKLLSASYQFYRHTGMDETKAILRTVGYSLPAALHAHVQTVAPTTYFASPRTPLQTPHKRSSENSSVMANATSGKLAGVLSKRRGDVTPPFLRWLYKTQAYVPSAMGQNAIGILGFFPDVNPSREDLKLFMANFREDAEAATFTVVRINGGNDPSEPTVDADAHMQYTAAISYPTPHILYGTSGSLRWRPVHGPESGDGYREWLNYILAQSESNIPRTISIPYGNPETEVPPRYTLALCTLFAQLGARGVSIVVASGNDGVGNIRDCADRRRKIKFAPMFPASCPWVTSVGSTTNNEPEVAAAFSGGGFSRHFRRPAYQSVAGHSYLYHLGTKKYRGLFERGGRGIPDIASQAQQFVSIHNNDGQGVSGALCSTSTVAGIVALLNDYQISRGKAALGFLNIWLYRIGLAAPMGFNDIAIGNNPGCGTEGFSAMSGWDPVTGLGTLNFEILQRLLDTIPPESSWGGPPMTMTVREYGRSEDSG